MSDRTGRTQQIAVLGRLSYAVVHAGHAARNGAYPSVPLDGGHNVFKEPVEFGLGNHAYILAEDATERLRPIDDDRHRPFSFAAAAARLMHGAGIISLGFLMDAIADRHRQLRIPPPDVFAGDLLPLRDECRWTDGYWDFGPGAQRKWNEIQNTTRDIQVLSNHLLVRYKALVWNRPSQPATNGDARRSKTRMGRKTG